jgi:hypothetical protein
MYNLSGVIQSEEFAPRPVPISLAVRNGNTLYKDQRG